MKTMELKHFVLFYISVFLFCLNLQGQPVEKLVKVLVAPDHTDWIYKTGENVKFSVSVIKNNEPVTGVKVNYEFGPEMMTPTKQETAILKNGSTEIVAGTMKEPGFLRCKVVAEYEGLKYEGLATAGFNPELIKPTTQLPSDFKQFWDKAKQELSAVPLDAKLTLLPGRCTEKTNVYEVNIQNYKNTRLYGILCIPKKEGKYPALVRVPGAGVRGYMGDISTADEGIITLETGIHGISVTMDPSVYLDLGKSALNGYMLYNLDDRDNYYYKKVYLGCVRAFDLIFSLPEFDGVNLGVNGGSQGCSLSIVSAGLDNRVKYLSTFYPAFWHL